MITKEQLRALPTLASFTDGELEILLTVAAPRKYPAGETLMREGDAGRSCVILVTGELDVVKRVGGREEALAKLKPGVMVGQVALIDRVPRTATVKARTDATALEVSRDDFDRLLKAHSPLALRFQEQIAVAGARQLRAATDRLARILEATDASSGLPPVDSLAMMRISLDEWGFPVEVNASTRPPRGA